MNFIYFPCVCSCILCVVSCMLYVLSFILCVFSCTLCVFPSNHSPWAGPMGPGPWASAKIWEGGLSKDKNMLKNEFENRLLPPEA